MAPEECSPIKSIELSPSSGVALFRTQHAAWARNRCSAVYYRRCHSVLRNRRLDNLTQADRSRTMSRVRSTNTKPEIVVRRVLHGLGLRFRLHRSDLPGKPDIVLARHRTIVLVHGCFWHGHNCRRGAREPKQNGDYWRAKRERNMARDRSNIQALKATGWKVEVIWECELKTLDCVRNRLALIPVNASGAESA